MGTVLLKLLPQLFGLLGMGCLFLSYQQTKREKLIACKLGADVMWVCHYLLLGAAGGAIPNFSGIFRELIFMQREKHKWARSVLWPIFFIGLNMTLTILTWKSALTLIPVTASVFVTLSLWARKPKITRMIGAPVSVCFIIYDIFVGSYVGIINESIAILSIVSSYIKNDRKKKENAE